MVREVWLGRCIRNRLSERPILLSPPLHGRWTLLLRKLAPFEVEVVAADVREPGVLRNPLTSVALELRVVIHRRSPVGGWMGLWVKDRGAVRAETATF